MPSVFAEPTVAELMQAFVAGVRTRGDRYMDAHEGSIYEHFNGPAAILWNRAAKRTTDLWNKVYVDSAEGLDLTVLLSERYGFDRIPDGYGVGTALLRRPTATAGAGTIWQGTRIITTGAAETAKRFIVTNEPVVDASALTATVEIRAERPGPGTGIAVSGGAARLDDPLWDPTWSIARLECSDGTAFEPAPHARARMRDERRKQRTGFVDAIVAACKVAGATNAVLFASDYAGDDADAGLNMAYIGDGGFSGDEALVRRVAIELEKWRVLGDQLQVRPLSRANLQIAARVYLWDTPARVNVDDTLKRLMGTILGHFSGAEFSYNLDAIAGAMMKASPSVQFVGFDSPMTDADVVTMVDGALNFPEVLTRYTVAANDVTLSFLPPL